MQTVCVTFAVDWTRDKLRHTQTVIMNIMYIIYKYKYKYKYKSKYKYKYKYIYILNINITLQI